VEERKKKKYIERLGFLEEMGGDFAGGRGEDTGAAGETGGVGERGES
jgi:hypothetical protein